MPTLRQGLYDLLTSVSIDTKERGRTQIEPWMSQKLVLDAIARGLSEDVHEFVILKSRQMAITTTCSVVELFWSLAYPGVQGAVIADRTDNLERLRRIFAQLLESLPPDWRGPEHRLVANNRTGIAFQNGSVLDLLAAGSNPDLGASRAINLLHATECSLWRSLAGVESLKAALARQNPHRLYLWESVSNGFNWWYSFCQQAKKDTRRMRFIFCGFWANPTYAIPKTDPDYKTYWDGHLDDEELTRARLVKQLYGVTVKPEQIAWWRRESEFSAEEYMLRHYPWHETEAFIASGSGFFPAQKTLEIGEAAASLPYRGYAYTFTEKFLESTIDQVRESEQVHLRVWELPEPDGVYAIGCDPSGGGGGESDDHAIQVLRCYSNRVVQVAEFQSNRPMTYQLAWVLAHLCGAYSNHMANLEVTGVGAAVMPELRNLRQLADMGLLNAVPGMPEDQILRFIGAVRWFLYNRQDVMGGAGNVINWKTNIDNKAMIYSALRDSLMLRRIEIRSHRLVTQMQSIVEDNGWIGAGPDTGENDDLVSALTLAHWTWIQWQRTGLEARGLTWESVKGDRPPMTMSDVGSQAFREFFQNLNRRQREHREKF